MTIPGFSAQCAIGPVAGYRATSRPGPGARVAPARANLGGASSGAFWPCFRNCYDRCGGSPDGCFGNCYWICNWNPNVWF